MTRMNRKASPPTDTEPTGGNTTDQRSPAAPAPSLDDILAGPRSTRYQIIIVVVCALIAMIDGYDTQVIALAAPNIATSWSIQASSFGPVFGIGLFGGLIGALIFGFVSDHYGRKPTLLIAVIFFGLVALSTPLASNITELFFIRFLTGLGLGGALPSIISITAEYTPARRRNTVVGIMFCGFPFGAVVAGILSNRLIPSHGWHVVFIVGGAVPLVLVPVIWRLLPESARFLALKGRRRELQAVLHRIGAPGLDPAGLQVEAKQVRSPVTRLFTGGRAVTTLMLWLTFLLSLLLTYLLTNWIPIIAQQAGASASGALLGVAALNFGAIFGCLTIGRVADRWRPTRTISIAFLLGAVFIALIGHANTSVPLLLTTCLLAGFFSIGGQMCTVALCAGFYETSLRATGVGWAVGIGRIGAIAGPVLGRILIGGNVSIANILLITAVASVGAAAAYSPSASPVSTGTPPPPMPARPPRPHTADLEEMSMPKRKRLVDLLDENMVPIGMQCFTGDHTIIEVMGAAGFDYVWIDTEHSALNPRALEDTMRTCELAGLIPLVRIPEAMDGTSARRALEAGAEGIIVPMVRSANDIETIVAALTFPPRGTRGLCPALRIPGYSVTQFNDYMRVSDDNLLIIPMIETVEALADIDAICALDQVRMIVFAAGELAFAMGEGAAMHSSAKVKAAQQEVFAAARRHGVALIGGPILDPSAQSCAKALDDGISVLCLGIDVLAFRRLCETTVAAATTAVHAHAHLSRPPAPPSGFPASM